jgi:hypothetical protein
MVVMEGSEPAAVNERDIMFGKQNNGHTAAVLCTQKMFWQHATRKNGRDKATLVIPM